MISIETNLTPTFAFDPLAPSTGSDLLDKVLGLLKPTIRGVPLAGTIAPYGEATPGLGTAVFVGVLILAAVGAVALVKGRV